MTSKIMMHLYYRVNPRGCAVSVKIKYPGITGVKENAIAREEIIGASSPLQPLTDSMVIYLPSRHR
jgi:hypothetical protein